MLTDFIKSDGTIIGAIGFAMENNDLFVFKTKAIVLCSGCSSFKPDGWPVSELTGDGEAMAFRAGAKIGGKEFNEIKSTSATYPAATMGMFLWEKDEPGISTEPDPGPPQCQALRGINAEGREVYGLVGSNFMELEFEAHAGRAPILSPSRQKTELIQRVGGAAVGISIHTSGGIWPSSTKCDTSLPGLYVAGDSCATMQVGSVYPGVGYAICGASVTGARAGFSAAEFAKSSKLQNFDHNDFFHFKENL
jgi:succinate dehydrogenase/fumarate reductase flavoprotein subunit